MADIKEIVIGQDIYVIRDQNAVKKSGDTMTGNLTVNGTITANPTSAGDTKTAMICYQKTGSSYGNTTYGNVFFKDDDGNNVAIIGSSQDSSGNNGLRFLSWDKDARTWKSHPHLLTTYVSGNSGYRIWSDGFCEQWGSYTLSTNNSSISISYLKTFANTNYNLMVSKQVDNNFDNSVYATKIRTRSTTGFVGACNVDVSNSLFIWKACGYLADGQY